MLQQHQAQVAEAAGARIASIGDVIGTRVRRRPDAVLATTGSTPPRRATRASPRRSPRTSSTPPDQPPGRRRSLTAVKAAALPTARQGAGLAGRTAGRAGSGRRSRRPARRRPVRGPGRRGAAAARRSPPRRRGVRAPHPSCRPARSSRRAGSPARPHRPAARASADQPSTEAWWQCGWATTSTPLRSGGCQPGVVGEQLGQRAGGPGDPLGRRRRRPARAPRSAAPRCTTAPRRRSASRRRPAATSDSTVPRRGCDGPRSSWPVVIQVRPQQVSAPGHVHPVAGRLEHARRGGGHVRGEVVGERVDPQRDRRAVGREGPARGPLLRGTCARRTCGTSRRWSMPAPALASRPPSFEPSTRLTSFGARAARSDQNGSRPSV